MSAAAGAPHVVVVGGGLAGLSAALDCVDAGARVTVLERRRRLGGLTWSYQRDGRWIDNGQHVFLRCCHAYLGFLRRVGSDGDVCIQDRLDVTVLRAGRSGVRTARLRRRPLPAPLHLGGSLLRYGHLGLADRARIGLAALPLRQLNLSDPRLDTETFGAWLARHGQSPLAISALWDLITVATVNLPAAEASLAMGAKVFQTGLLRRADAADIGWAGVPLGRLHGEAAAAALAATGAEVVTAAPVDRIETGPGGLVVCSGPSRLAADSVIVAVPHTEVAGLLPGSPVTAHLDGLGVSPIIDVHLVYDRPVTTLPLLAALDSPAQWIFDRTASSGLAAAGAGGPDTPTAGPTGTGGQQYLAVSVSAADAHLGARPEAVADLIAAELRRLLPAAADATVIDRFVTKERSATFRAVPGTAALRPGPASGVAGVHLAGAWTATGWPATMEGAVRSGRRAARAALAPTRLTRQLPAEVA